MYFRNSVCAADSQILFIRGQTNAGQSVRNGWAVEIAMDIVVDNTHLPQAVHIVILEYITQVFVVTGNTPQMCLCLVFISS